MTQEDVLDYLYKNQNKLFMKGIRYIRAQIRDGEYEEAYHNIQRKLTRGPHGEQATEKAGV